MGRDAKREALRHLLATVTYRGGIAIADAPDGFADFRAADSVRTPVEIFAHIGDLLEGSFLLLNGELRYLNSSPLPWQEEAQRFRTAAGQLDAFLASESAMAYPAEQFIQGPIGDALTHVGQLAMLRRMAGSPIPPVNYFSARVVPGTPTS